MFSFAAVVLAVCAQTATPATGPTDADADRHVDEMRASGRLPKGMTVVWVKPFLVIGDEAPATVRMRANATVRWMRDLLLHDFFDEPPATLQEVWVLKDAASYEHTSRDLFHREPPSPYGYYAPEGALVMNIKPGYGTLTHEMTHAFFARAFGDTPAWLNEGVASLFERPAEKDGHLVGKVNWRLPALTSALRKKTAPSFAKLVHLDDAAFYGTDRAVNYATARYLCMWLQERGLLTKLVKLAQRTHATDPSGWQALTDVLGRDPDDTRADWERYVTSLASTH